MIKINILLRGTTEHLLTEKSSNINLDEIDSIVIYPLSLKTKAVRMRNNIRTGSSDLLANSTF